MLMFQTFFFVRITAFLPILENEEHTGVNRLFFSRPFLKNEWKVIRSKR